MSVQPSTCIVRTVQQMLKVLGIMLPILLSQRDKLRRGGLRLDSDRSHLWGRPSSLVGEPLLLEVPLVPHSQARRLDWQPYTPGRISPGLFPVPEVFRGFLPTFDQAPYTLLCSQSLRHSPKPTPHVRQTLLFVSLSYIDWLCSRLKLVKRNQSINQCLPKSLMGRSF